ncbi:MAG: TetR/AcrR family transcriptional regulator [Pseudomonadota bacterium]
MTKRRYGKADWIDLGLQELAAHGSEAVKLEAICKAAKLTRGSFYHHFEDHEAFLTGLAEHWLARQTTDVADLIDPNDTPIVQYVALNEAAMGIDYRLELGIRELARRLPAIDRIIKQADAVRLDVVRTLYQRRYGIEEDLAEGLAIIEYAAFSGIILLDPDISLERQRSLAKLHEDMMRRALGQENAQ